MTRLLAIGLVVTVGAVLVGGCGAPAVPSSDAASASAVAPPTAAPSTAAPAASAPAASPSASLDPEAARVAGWTAAIDAFVPGLERLHPDPFHATSRASLETELDALRASIPTASDDELMVGLVSAVGR